MRKSCLLWFVYYIHVVPIQTTVYLLFLSTLLVGYGLCLLYSINLTSLQKLNGTTFLTPPSPGMSHSLLPVHMFEPKPENVKITTLNRCKERHFKAATRYSGSACKLLIIRRRIL